MLYVHATEASNSSVGSDTILSCKSKHSWLCVFFLFDLRASIQSMEKKQKQNIVLREITELDLLKCDSIFYIS